MPGIVKSESEYFEYLGGKRVCLVGPGEVMLEKGQGKEIDGYDVVVNVSSESDRRENKPEDDYGCRSDISYTFLDTMRYAHRRKERIAEIKEKWIVSTTTNSKYVPEYLTFMPEDSYFVSANNALWGNIKKEMGTCPFTGLVALLHLLESPLKTLSVYGMDFYYTDSYAKSKCPKNVGLGKHHDPQKMAHYFLKLNDDRLNVDSAFVAGINYWIKGGK